MNARIAAFAALALTPFTVNAQFIADQIGAPPWVTAMNPVVNQMSLSMPWLDQWAYEDIVVATASTLQYVEIVATCTGVGAPHTSAQWAATGPWTLNLHTDAGGQPGALIMSAIYAPGMFTAQAGYALGGTVKNALLNFPISGFLAPGVYWFSVVPDISNNPAWTMGIARSNFPSGFPNNFNALSYIVPTYTPTGLNLAVRVAQ